MSKWIYAHTCDLIHRTVTSLTGQDSATLIRTKNNIFSCLVGSNPVKPEKSHTVILPSAIIVLCFMPTISPLFIFLHRDKHKSLYRWINLLLNTHSHPFIQLHTLSLSLPFSLMQTFKEQTLREICIGIYGLGQHYNETLPSLLNFNFLASPFFIWAKKSPRVKSFAIADDEMKGMKYALGTCYLPLMLKLAILCIPM